MRRYHSNECPSSQKWGPLLLLRPTCGCMLSRRNKSVVPHLLTPSRWKKGMQNSAVSLRQHGFLNAVSKPAAGTCSNTSPPAATTSAPALAAQEARLRARASNCDSLLTSGSCEVHTKPAPCCSTAQQGGRSGKPFAGTRPVEFLRAVCSSACSKPSSRSFRACSISRAALSAARLSSLRLAARLLM